VVKRRDAYRVLLGQPEGKRPLGKHKLRWEDNIKTSITEIVWEIVEWIGLALERDN
jgi:hypothetical protein